MISTSDPAKKCDGTGVVNYHSGAPILLAGKCPGVILRKSRFPAMCPSVSQKDALRSFLGAPCDEMR